jgi:hypothetical protein
MGVPEVNDALPAAPPSPHRVSWLAVGLGGLMVVGLLVGLGLLGELGPFILAGFNVLPFVALAVLAALGERHGWARWLAYPYHILLVLGLLLGSFLLVAGALVDPVTMGRSEPQALLAMLGPAFGYLALGLVMTVVSLLPLLPPVRRWAEARLPLRANSVMNATALSAVLALTLLPLTALAVLGGRPPLLTMVSRAGDPALTARPQDLVYGLVWLLPASLVLVGFPLRRGFGEAVARLGLVWPTWRQVVVALGVAVALVLAAIFVLDPVINWVWGGLGWPRTDTKAVEKLMAGLMTPLGAVVIAVTAGLGEEIGVRGVLQPRVGLVLANLAFTAVHGYQYGFDGLLSVFLIGLVMGLLRARTNTTTSAIAHGAYDFIVVLASVLGF